jgi:hypothetical protein
MNANELADELVWIAKNRGDSISRQLADIVRQQQAEIEALKKRYEPKIVDMCLRTDEQGRVLPQREIE